MVASKQTTKEGGGQPNMQVAPKTNKRQTHKGKTSKNMEKSLDLSKQAQI